MKSFLSKLAQLGSVRYVILLSTGNEPLFSSLPLSGSRLSREMSGWKDCLAGLDKPQSAELVFEGGRFYLRSCALGYVIMSLADNAVLEKIKLACDHTLPKLTNRELRKKALLNMLKSSSDTLKPGIIKELAPLADPEVAAALVTLLRKEADFDPVIREKLLLFICQALGYCSASEAVEPLRQLLSGLKVNGHTVTAGQIRDAVALSYRQLEASILRRPSSPGLAKRLEMDASPTPSGLRREKGEKTAQTVINPHIARPLPADINKDHLAVWKDLATALSPEEFSALYYAMTLKCYANGTVIAKLGDILSTLFFITSGRVQILAPRLGQAIPVGVMEAGELFGIETFFQTSVWTANVKSLGSEMLLLPRQQLDAMQKSYPALEAKLTRFCSGFQTTSTLIKNINKNRREFERTAASGRLSFAVLDNNGNDTGVGANGNLLDISRGGVAFSIHSSKKKNAVGLFGRNIRVNLYAGMPSGQLNKRSVVRAVLDQELTDNEYSIHTMFSETLSSTELQRVLSAPA